MASDRTFITPDTHAWSKDMPASAAVRVGELLFVSGQVSVDAALRTQAPGDVTAQARNAFERMRGVPLAIRVGVGVRGAGGDNDKVSLGE